jgi:hypothetical protein
MTVALSRPHAPVMSKLFPSAEPHLHSYNGGSWSRGAALLCLSVVAGGCSALVEPQDRDPGQSIERVAPAAESSLPEVSEGSECEVFDRSAEAATHAPEGPTGSSALALTEADCDSQHVECFQRCWSAKPPWPITKGKAGHYKYCQSKCLTEYMACLAAAGLVRTFASLGQARFWLAQNPHLAVGTLVLIAGAVYVVSTGGAGALILLPAML